MNRRRELLLVTLLLLLAALLRTWDLTRLPPGLSNDELAELRLTETVRQGTIAVYYHVGDGRGWAGMYALGNAPLTDLVGGGLLGYRLLPLWGSLLTLALLYALARRLFGVPVALVALGVMSVNLRAILLARTATAESLVPLYTLLMLLGLAMAFNLRRAVSFRVPATLPFVLLALLLGASGYLHYTTLVLGPLGGIFFVHLLVTRQPLSRRVWNAMIFVIVLTTIVATPYLISTLRDPHASEPYDVWAQRPHSVTDVVDGALRAIGGVIWQGDPRATQNLPDAALVGPVVAILLIIGGVASARRWREPGYALVLLTLLAGLLTDVWMGREPNFTALLVALPAVYILPGIGVVAIWRTLRARGVQWSGQTLSFVLVVLLAINLFTLRSRFFDHWANHAQTADAYHATLGHIAAYLDRTPDGPPVSMCGVGMREMNEVGLSQRQILRLMMHRDLPIRHSDCRSGLVFINAGAPMRFIFMSPDDRRQMPPELQDWLADARPIHVNGLPDGLVLRLDVEQQIRDAGGFWASLAPTQFMPDEGGTSAVAELPVTLEQNLTFAGYDPRLFEGTRLPGGDPIVLVTYWRVDGRLPPDLKFFAQLLAYPNPQLEPLAEADAIDVIPHELEKRDIFAQVSYIWPSSDITPGEYVLTVGAYRRDVAVLDDHLGVLDRQTGERRGERLLLGTIVMVGPPEPGS